MFFSTIFVTSVTCVHTNTGIVQRPGTIVWKKVQLQSVVHGVLIHCVRVISNSSSKLEACDDRQEIKWPSTNHGTSTATGPRLRHPAAADTRRRLARVAAARLGGQLIRRRRELTWTGASLQAVGLEARRQRRTNYGCRLDDESRPHAHDILITVIAFSICSAAHELPYAYQLEICITQMAWPRQPATDYRYVKQFASLIINHSEYYYILVTVNIFIIRPHRMHSCGQRRGVCQSVCRVRSLYEWILFAVQTLWAQSTLYYVPMGSGEMYNVKGGRMRPSPNYFGQVVNIVIRYYFASTFSHQRSGPAISVLNFVFSN